MPAPPSQQNKSRSLGVCAITLNPRDERAARPSHLCKALGTKAHAVARSHSEWGRPAKRQPRLLAPYPSSQRLEEIGERAAGEDDVGLGDAGLAEAMSDDD